MARAGGHSVNEWMGGWRVTDNQTIFQIYSSSDGANARKY